MAYVITAVGAGGKTTYLKKRAKEYLSRGKRVAITTTTHIWPPFRDACSAADRVSEAESSSGAAGENNLASVWYGGGKEPDYYGILQSSGKLAALSDEQFSQLCESYDVVLVEGDGSHCMPVKIPGEYEPVIPDSSDEIAVVMGAHALGRRIDIVCQRYRSDLAGEMQGYPQGIVTEEMLREIAEHYYIEHLRCKYPRTKIFYVLSRMPEPDGKIAAVVMASGFGRRYGGNKLLDLYHGKPLYHHVMEHVTGAFGTENTVVVTQYPKIFEEVRAMGADAVMNPCAQEGIAASIRLGTEWALKAGAEAVIFFAADMPNLPSEEIRFYADQFLSSGKPYGCMVFGPEHICTNPGAFRLKTGASRLLDLTGDRGAMRIMKMEPWNIYYYQIAPECCEDIDLKV